MWVTFPLHRVPPALTPLHPRHTAPTPSSDGLWVAPHQVDVILWPQQFHHEVQVLPLLLLLGTLGPLPIRLVPLGLLLTGGFLQRLRASLRCIATAPSILQSQDRPTEHCKALPGRVMGKHYSRGSQTFRNV